MNLEQHLNTKAKDLKLHFIDEPDDKYLSERASTHDFVNALLVNSSGKVVGEGDCLLIGTNEAYLDDSNLSIFQFNLNPAINKSAFEALNSNPDVNLPVVVEEIINNEDEVHEWETNIVIPLISILASKHNVELRVVMSGKGDGEFNDRCEIDIDS